MRVLILLLLALFGLQSCSVNTETTYYKDAATSMESNILLDQSTLQMVGMMGEQQGILKSEEFKNLTTEWKSLAEIQKKSPVILNTESSKILDKLFLKLNKNKGQVYGLSLKYDKLLPSEVTSLLRESKELQTLPLQNIASWNGKSLTIDTEKFNSAQILEEIAKAEEKDVPKKPVTKSDSIEVYGKQMAQGVLGMMKLFNMNFSNTLKFQKPIKSITGKHDFVKQVDSKTVVINVRSKDLLDGAQKLVNKDKLIIITTE